MTRIDIINHLIRQNNYQTYLEIGTQHGQCFCEIEIPYKECVDPIKNYEGLTHQMTSDEYFTLNTKTFDIIFVDGLHTEEQSTQDVTNALRILNDGGVIVVHDCLPATKEFTQACWNGTVYRTVIELRYSPDVCVTVIDADCGCGIIYKGPQKVYSKVPLSLAKTYYYYERNKQELMNVISLDEFMNKHAICS